MRTHGSYFNFSSVWLSALIQVIEKTDTYLSLISRYLKINGSLGV